MTPAMVTSIIPPAPTPVRMTSRPPARTVFNIGLKHCPNCGGTLKIIAAVEDPPVIDRILPHLGLPARALPCSPARPPTPFQPPDLPPPDGTQFLSEPTGRAARAKRAAREGPRRKRAANEGGERALRRWKQKVCELQSQLALSPNTLLDPQRRQHPRAQHQTALLLLLHSRHLDVGTEPAATAVIHNYRANFVDPRPFHDRVEFNTISKVEVCRFTETNCVPGPARVVMLGFTPVTE